MSADAGSVSIGRAFARRVACGVRGNARMTTLRAVFFDPRVLRIASLLLTLVLVACQENDGGGGGGVDPGY
jgi:hypothetical protein